MEFSAPIAELGQLVSKLHPNKAAEIRTHRRDTVLGAAFALLSAFLVAVASASIQGLQRRWPDFELAVFRWSCMTLVTGCYFLVTRTLPSIPRDKILPVLFIALLVSTGEAAFYVAVTFLPLGLSAAVYRISIISSAALASRLIEKERLSTFRVIAVAIGIVSIVLMTQPEFIFGEDGGPRVAQNNTGKNDSESSTPGPFLPMDILSILEPESTSTQDTEVLAPENNATTHNHSEVLGPENNATTHNHSEVLGPENNATTHNHTAPQGLTNSLSTSEPENVEDTEKTEKQAKSLIPTEGLSEATMQAIGICLTIASGIRVVAQGVIVKRKNMRGVSCWCICFWIGVVGLLWTIPLSLTLEDVVFITTFQDLSLAFLSALASGTHSLFFFLAVERCSYLIVCLIMVTQLMFNLIAQYTLLADILPGKQNFLEILGGCIVMVAAIMPTVAEAWEKKVKKGTSIKHLAAHVMKVSTILMEMSREHTFKTAPLDQTPGQGTTVDCAKIQVVAA